MADSNWPPLESDPSLFNDYMHECGMPQTWGFNELYGFDDELLDMVPKPVLAVVVNFEKIDNGEMNIMGFQEYESRYFMNQSGALDNACGVIACLHAIYNNLEQIPVAEGTILRNFHNQVKDMDGWGRADALENFAEIK